MKLPDFRKNIARRLASFLFKPASAIPLAALRISLGFALLLQAYLMRSSVFELFSRNGYIQGELAKTLNNASLPQISDLQNLLQPFQATESFCISFVCFSYLLSLVFLTIGWQTNAMALLAWLFHWMLMNSADSTTYGVDLYIHVFLFYLIWIPSGAAWSFDAWKKGDINPASPRARLGLRLLQLQLCITYLASGLEKAQGAQWWNGELLWRALSMPVYRQFEMSWLAYWPHLSMLAGWSTLVLEIGYCIFIWPQATRKLWVVGVVGMHFGILLFLGLHIFGLVMMLLTICLFGFSAEALPARSASGYKAQYFNFEQPQT